MFNLYAVKINIRFNFIFAIKERLQKTQSLELTFFYFT